MNKEMEKKEIISLLERERNVLREKFKVKKLGVFGSFARGENQKSSDVDILVEFSEPVGFFLFIDLENYLSGLFGLKVDLVTKNALKPAIKDKIISDVVYAE